MHHLIRSFVLTAALSASFALRAEGEPRAGRGASPNPFGGNPEAPAVTEEARVPYTLSAIEFTASREVLDGAFASKSPYEALVEAAKSGKAGVRTFRAASAFGRRGSLTVSAQTPFVAGTTSATGERKYSTVDYRDLGTTFDFNLSEVKTGGAEGDVSLSVKRVESGVTIDENNQPVIVMRRASGSLRFDKGVPALLATDDAEGDKPGESRAVFVRADW